MCDRQSNEETIGSPSDRFDSLRHVSQETPCPYLPGRPSRSEAYYVDGLDGADYERLLARGFRRSGRVVYRPRCRNCQECRSLRVPVAEFHLTRSMRRIRRQNADIRVELKAPEPTDEKFNLFCRYLDHQHDGTMARSERTFVEFLYDSPMKSLEFQYRLGDRLVGVGIVDCWNAGMSSVYMFFEPACAARSLGTFSVLWEVDHCRRHGIPYYYLGYYVAGSRTMAYKARFRPNEILVGDDRWLIFQRAGD